MIVTRTLGDAAEVLGLLRAGMNFGVIAKEHSIDRSAEDGGYINPERIAELPPGELTALRELRPGELTDALRVPEGFAIFTDLQTSPRTKDLDQEHIEALAKAAHIRQSINVAGMSEEDAVFAQYDKPKDWQQNLARPCEVRKQSHAAAVQRMQESIRAGQGGKAAPLDLLRSYVVLAQLQGFVGKMDESIKAWQSAYQIAQASVPGAVPYLQEALGSLYLHLSEMENGAYRDSGTTDLFPPLAPGAQFQRTEDSQRALKYFLAFLDRAPDDLQARWLLNLTYVTLGMYPDQVPPKYLIAPSVFASKQNIGPFTDVGRQAGLNVFSRRRRRDRGRLR